MADPLPSPRDDDTRMPRWVKLSLAAAGIAALVLGVMLLLGHGPGQHGMHQAAATQATPQ